MAAVHLAARGAQVVLIDRSGAFAEGLAYGTREPAHRLNIRASGMSACPDDDDHFTRWLMARGAGTGGSYAPRGVYRDYLGDILTRAGGAVEMRTDEAVSIDIGGVRLASGATLDVDAVVVTTGNLPPQPMRLFAKVPVPYAEDPWSEAGRAVLDRLAAQDGDVLVIGTGLTAIDTVLALDARGFAGRVVALSRRGLLPRPHVLSAAASIEGPRAGSPRELLLWVRAQATVQDWRSVVDSLRAGTQTIWQSWADADRSRFLRHLRPWWDVHRHRIAPDVWTRIEALIGGERLLVRAGRVVDATDNPITIRPRGSVASERLSVAGIVNCTGPQGDLRRGGSALIADLLARGIATSDTFGLGLNVDPGLRIVPGAKLPLYAIGPVTRGTLWETVAVPEIRGQAQCVADSIVKDFAMVQKRATVS